MPNIFHHYELGGYRGTECPQGTPLPRYLLKELKKELRYHQFRERARWFTLAAFDHEIYRQRYGLRDAIDFEFFCKIRAATNPIPRDPFEDHQEEA